MEHAENDQRVLRVRVPHRKDMDDDIQHFPAPPCGCDETRVGVEGTSRPITGTIYPEPRSHSADEQERLCPLKQPQGVDIMKIIDLEMQKCVQHSDKMIYDHRKELKKYLSDFEERLSDNSLSFTDQVTSIIEGLTRARRLEEQQLRFEVQSLTQKSNLEVKRSQEVRLQVQSLLQKFYLEEERSLELRLQVDSLVSRIYSLEEDRDQHLQHCGERQRAAGSTPDCPRSTPNSPVTSIEDESQEDSTMLPNGSTMS